MIQVKIIRQRAQSIEGEINDFLKRLGSVPGQKVDLKDIKLYHSDVGDTDTAMIIYNAYTSKPKTTMPEVHIPQPTGAKVDSLGRVIQPQQESVQGKLPPHNNQNPNNQGLRTSGNN